MDVREDDSFLQFLVARKTDLYTESYRLCEAVRQD